jgi:hypothetical protein
MGEWCHTRAFLVRLPVRVARKMRRSMKDLSLLRAVKTESVPGVTLLYFEHFIDCTLGVKRVQSYLKLLGVGHKDSTAINIEIEGFISSEAAKTAAVFGTLF